MPTLITGDAHAFDSFVKHLWSDLSSSTQPPTDGIFEAPGLRGPFQVALDRKRRFAAFKWLCWSQDDEAQLVGHAHAFCLPTRAGGKDALRLGLQQWHAPGAPKAPAATSKKAALNPEGFMAAWLQSLGLQWDATEQPLPGFLELSTVLAAQGQIVTSSHQVLQRLSEAEVERDYYRQLSDTLDEEVRQLQAKLRAGGWEGAWKARSQAAAAGESSDLTNPSLPSEWEALPDWISAHEGRIAVMPRALNACKKALYEKPRHLFAGLHFLATAYRDNRLGKLSTADMEQALYHAGLRLAGSVAPSIAGEQGDAYFVPWQGRRRFLDLHLLRGGGRDERYCLRIYFFWDDATEQCVVGWMPSHLSNSLS